MASIVGPKGQIVIPKEIRSRLGIEPGWIAIQRLVGDHVEVYFILPEHNNSLKGVLSKYIKKKIPQGEEWSKSKEVSWNEAVSQKIIKKR